MTASCALVLKTGSWLSVIESQDTESDRKAALTFGSTQGARTLTGTLGLCASRQRRSVVSSLWILLLRLVGLRTIADAYNTSSMHTSPERWILAPVSGRYSGQRIRSLLGRYNLPALRQIAACNGCNIERLSEQSWFVSPTTASAPMEGNNL
jgi:hypothetical protein